MDILSNDDHLFSKVIARDEFIKINKIRSIGSKVLLHNNNEYKKYYIEHGDNIIPKLTSYVGINGMAISVSEFSTYPAWYAFDGNDTTNWAQNTSGGGWIGYKFNEPKCITKYEMIAQRSKDWTFEGSNNGINWVVLHSCSLSSTNLLLMSFDIINNNKYTHYRVNTLTTFQFGTNMHTLKMYESISSGWETVSTTLPTPDTFINDGMNDLSILDRKEITFNIPMNDNGLSGQILGNGKVFKEKIDLKKYIEIESIKVNKQ
ncbi:hypothetical protein D3C74_301150 [compost metagenome]